MKKEAMEVLLNRRAIRKFKADPIPADLLDAVPTKDQHQKRHRSPWPCPLVRTCKNMLQGLSPSKPYL